MRRSHYTHITPSPGATTETEKQEQAMKTLEKVINVIYQLAGWAIAVGFWIAVIGWLES